MNITVQFFSDPGHGWGRINKKLLSRLSLENSITPYSYENGEFVYLEEDCDLPRFAAAAKAAGITVSYKDRRSEGMSRIRGYASYKKPGGVKDIGLFPLKWGDDEARADLFKQIKSAWASTCPDYQPSARYQWHRVASDKAWFLMPDLPETVDCIALQGRMALPATLVARYATWLACKREMAFPNCHPHVTQLAADLWLPWFTGEGNP